MTPGEAALRNAPSDVCPGQGRFQVVDVGERRGRVADPDRAGAGGRSAAGPAGIAKHPHRQVRELTQVLIDEGIAAAGETGQSVLNVGGIAGLRHLAIVDEIDA
jgi:hypothetical protein